MAGWSFKHGEAFKEKPCDVCGTIFKPKSGIHKHCSAECKGKWKYLIGTCSTEVQYKTISGNWYKYFQRLCSKASRKDGLTPYDLFKMLNEQGGKCALSGEFLTCELVKGVKCHTNASIDRIIAGGAYTKDNVQLVCAVLNSFRRDTNLKEFINWCKKVGEYTK